MGFIKWLFDVFLVTLAVDILSSLAEMAFNINISHIVKFIIALSIMEVYGMNKVK